MSESNKLAVEKYLRGVYGGDPNVVDELAAEDVISTYPIFSKLFGTPVLKGRDALREFAAGFGRRWVDTEITIDEVVSEGDKVVLVWRFSGRQVGSANPEVKPANERQSWGGITLFKFNHSGKITAEIGEESEPGPMGRIEL